MLQNRRESRVALISMPWSLFNRPSVQLGALKSFLEQTDHITVDCFHPYLGVAEAVSTATYEYLSKKSWASEALYSAVLYPQNRARAKRLYTKNCRDNKGLAGCFDQITAQLDQHLNQWLSTIDFGRYKIIGFSVCFNQLFSSLAAAQRIKKKYPEVKIVFGGSSCTGDTGKSLLHHFPQVDCIIEGEGEQALMDLCVSNSIISSCTTGSHSHYGSELQNLNCLPLPDYHPYFAELDTIFPGRPFTPTLPLEFSRGCWWAKCSFCNLNLQWHGYRYKQADKIIAEVKKLVHEHQALNFTFCDNSLPPKESLLFFKKLSEEPLDISFFAEIRALNNPEHLRIYREGGLNSVQAGIESLSGSLLGKMKKGTTVIENLSVMKLCAETGIELDGNLIVEYPGTTQQEIEETLHVLDYALPYKPLTAATFFVGAGSPIEQQPGEHNLGKVVAHGNSGYLFPVSTSTSIDMLIKDYRGDKTLQVQQWKPVRRKIQRWHTFHQQRKKKSLAPLSYRDGGSFIIIHQEQIEDSQLLHRLQGTSRKLYLFCKTIRTIEEIEKQFPKFSRKALLNFFDDLSNKHLLFRENNRFLSLAIHQRWQ